MALFLIIGLMILPSLYAWFNLKAGWDPYGNTSKIPIAVTNLDKGATIHKNKITKTIHVGDEMVDQLKKNHSLGWTFVSQKEAERGVKHGDYYASILIPKDFSKNISSIIAKSPTHPKIVYTVNEKVNAIAPKITTTGASTITENLNETIVRTASEALFTEFNKVGIELERELPTLRRLKSQIFELQARLPEIKSAGEKILAFEKKLPEIDQKAQKILTIEKLLPDIEKAGQALLQLEERLPEIQKAGDDLATLQSRLPDIQSAVNRVVAIDQSFDHLSKSFNQALANVQAISQVIQKAQSGLNELQSLAENGESTASGIHQFLQANDQTFQTLTPVIQQNLLLIQQTNDGVANTAQALRSGDTPPDVNALSKMQNRLIASRDASQHLENLITTLNQLMPSAQLQAQEKSLQALVKNQDQQINTMTAIQKSMAQSGSTSSSDNEHLLALTEQADRLLTSITNDSQGLSPTVSQDIQKLMTQAENANQTLSQSQSEIPKLQSLLDEANQAVAFGHGELERLQKDMPNIQAKIHSLVVGLQEKMPGLIKGVNQATAFMKNDFPKLVPKIHQAAQFVRQDLPATEADIHKLSDFVQYKLPEVEVTVHKVAGLVRHDLPELERSLHNATSKINAFEKENNLGDIIELLRHNIQKESDFLAHPVLLKEKKVFPIPNYGSGMSPFYTTLCLWVGALLLVSLLRIDVEDSNQNYRSYHIYFGRLLTFITIGLFQALIVTIGDMVLLGAYVKSPFWFVIFALFASVVFMTLVYTFVSLFGNIGKALGIILLVLQLSSGGGTFPIQVSPPFFQSIHPFLPFTYAISLMREAVGGIVGAIVLRDSLYLVFFLVIAILLGVMLKGPLQKYTQRITERAKESKLIH